ncbi:hypothetical protein R1flu_022443 [Riccia fluitans]|uniref:Uncharacterized protein n=1 Tax=Riccia fluitans TaxID=41844 RepID=A0ABD1XS78_9MARC
MTQGDLEIANDTCRVNVLLPIVGPKTGEICPNVLVNSPLRFTREESDPYPIFVKTLCDPKLRLRSTRRPACRQSPDDLSRADI